MQKSEASFATPEVQKAAKALGHAIRQARLARNRTREDFAQRAHISAPTLDRLERGDVAVRMGAWLSALQTGNLLHLLEKASMLDSDILGRDEREKRVRGAVRQRARTSTVPASKEDDYDF